MRRIGDIVVLEVGEPDTCELCGVLAKEVRPYGPNGEKVCYSCAIQNREAIDKAINKLLNGDSNE